MSSFSVKGKAGNLAGSNVRIIERGDAEMAAKLLIDQDGVYSRESLMGKSFTPAESEQNQNAAVEERAADAALQEQFISLEELLQRRRTEFVFL